MIKVWLCLICFCLSTLGVQAQGIGTIAIGKKKNLSDFEEHIDFEGMVKRYLNKTSPIKKLEGIYSVSAIISKRGGFLANPNREKIIAREDNYAKVVIMEDTENPKREFIEVSLASKIPGQYPVVGEFTSLAEGDAFVYKHYEPKTAGIKYSFVISEADILDGVMVEVIKRKTITYKLSYLKIYPKKDEMPIRNLTDNR